MDEQRAVTEALFHAPRLLTPPPAARSCMFPRGMARSPLALFLLLPALAAFVYPTPAHACPRTAFLVERLKTSDDYRVRTQAALALGASGDDAAVQPLCGALADGNATVKVAAAAALGKLSKAAGLSCSQSAEKTEAEPSVKTQLQKSIASLQAASTPGGPPPPPPGARTPRSTSPSR